MTAITAEGQSAITRARWLAGMLLGVGVTHFAWPKPFDGIVPAELPGSARFYTYASGVVEVAVGGMLLVPRTRRVGGLAAALLFVAVFPGNLNSVRFVLVQPVVAAGDDRPPAVTDPDGHRRAAGVAQRVGQRHGRNAATMPGYPNMRAAA